MVRFPPPRSSMPLSDTLTRRVSAMAGTALNKHKALQQFFKWLMVDEEEIDRSPMDRVRQPEIPQKLIAVMRDDETAKVLSDLPREGVPTIAR